jgi:hypothetical protein
MRTRRLGALLASLPLVVLAVTGAAAPPPPAALTYHGMFTAEENPVGDACAVGKVTGNWEVLVPDRAGERAIVAVHIKLDGRPHAMWRWDFILDKATGSSLAAHQELVWPMDPPVTDELTVALDHGVFTYHLASLALGCDVSFTGPQLS